MMIHGYPRTRTFSGAAIFAVIAFTIFDKEPTGSVVQ